MRQRQSFEDWKAGRMPKETTLQDLYFPVELRELRTVDGLETRHKGIVRTDTNEVVSVVTDDYTLVRNDEVFPELLGLFDKLNIEAQIKRTSIVNRGASSYVEVICPNESIRFGEDVNQLRVIITNSYDMTRAISLICGAFRLVCSNGLVLGVKFAQFTKKHIGDIDIGFNKSLIEDKIVQFREYKPIWQKMYDVSLGKQEGDNIIEVVQKKLEYPVRATETVKALWAKEGRDVPRNMWGLYNCYTKEISHSDRNIATQTLMASKVDHYFVGASK